jgi:hypothetical protein
MRAWDSGTSDQGVPVATLDSPGLAPAVGSDHFHLIAANGGEKRSKENAEGDIKGADQISNPVNQQSIKIS